MPYFPPVVIGDTSHDLSHLDPVIFRTCSTKLGRLIVTRCVFTTHVFTVQAPDGYSGPILLDEGKRLRVFSPERYALCHHLPDVMRMLSDPDRYVQQGVHERNWLHRVHVTLPDVIGPPIVFQVFFKVEKAGRLVEQDVEMTVESAYALDPRRQPKVLGRTKIAGLLAATVEGRKLHTQRKA